MSPSFSRSALLLRKKCKNIFTPSETKKTTKRSVALSAYKKPSWRYEPLEENQIRLLKLYPGDTETPICCSLQPVNLLDYEDVTAEASNQELGTYDAISYVWGDPELTSEIICDGRASHITVSLQDALRRLRDPKRIRILWADALCIDQSNAIERAEQVKLMGLIYWKARRVHIWLGHDHTNDPSLRAENAVHLMRRLGELWDGHARIGTPTYSLKLYGIESFGADNECGSSNDQSLEWKSMRSLLSRPWFQRVWVVQELGLSRDATFYCGETSFTRRELDHFVAFLQTRGNTLIRFHKLNLRMLGLGDHYHSSTRGNLRLEYGSDPSLAQNFLDVLEQAKGLKCTDPRDTIYAFLGHPAAFKKQLLDDAPYMWYPRNYYNRKETFIQPNYTNANTVLDLYAQVAITCIDNLGMGFEVLGHVAHDECTIEADYPSWIPRWDIHEASHFYSGRDVYYAASGNLPCSVLKLLSPLQHGSFTKLELNAKYLGRISSTCDLTATYLYSSLMTIIAGRSSELERKDFSSMARPNDLVNLAITFTAGLSTGVDLLLHSGEEDPTRHYLNFWAFIRREEAAQGLTNGTRLSEQFSDPDCDGRGDAEYYTVDTLRVAPYSTFFYDEEGRPGLGPRISCEGDEVWLIMGATMPFVFRKVGIGNYKILGRAYLHGVMNGEAVAESTEQDFELVTLL